MIVDGKRALAYTAKITDIKPIEGYDKVEYACVNGGWWCIVSKSDHFKPGDTCLYIEIDSQVPKNDERFAFLEKRKYRVRTIRMCGVISQGLVMPLVPFDMKYDTAIGIDLTERLDIKYYDPEDNERKTGNPNAKYMSMNMRHKKLSKKKWWKWLMKRNWGKKLLFRIFGKKKDNPRKFPTHFQFIKKSDEERIENCSWLLNNKKPFIITEKLDGTSSTYILERKKHNKFEFYVCSRNIRQKDENQECYHDTNIYWDMAFKYDIESKLKNYLLDYPELDYVGIQGESVGNVQGNPLKLKEDDLYVFNFIRSDVGRVNSIEGSNIIKSWGMKWVPILETEYILPDTLEEFKEYTHGYSVVNPEVLREGIVCRDYDSEISFKSVDKTYLLER